MPNSDSGLDDDIRFINERLRAFDSVIYIPDSVSAESLCKKIGSAEKKKGMVLNFKVIGTAAAAVMIITVLSVAMPVLMMKKTRGAVPEAAPKEAELVMDSSCAYAAAENEAISSSGAAQEGEKEQELLNAVGQESSRIDSIEILGENYFLVPEQSLLERLLSISGVADSLGYDDEQGGYYDSNPENLGEEIFSEKRTLQGKDYLLKVFEYLPDESGDILAVTLDGGTARLYFKGA